MLREFMIIPLHDNIIFYRIPNGFIKTRNLPSERFRRPRTFGI